MKPKYIYFCRDGRVIKRKDSKNKQQETTKPSNYYSDLPDSETIYYCIDQAKETENNAENEKRASAQDRNMYLDAIQYPVLTDEFRYDEAKEVEEINVLNMGLENKEMYLKMDRAAQKCTLTWVQREEMCTRNLTEDRCKHHPEMTSSKGPQIQESTHTNVPVKLRKTMSMPVYRTEIQDAVIPHMRQNSATK